MRNLAIGEFFINIGKAMLLLSFAKTLYDETGQIWAFSLSFLGEVAMVALLPFFTGKLIDEWGPRIVLLFSALIHIIFCIIGIGLLIQFEPTSLLLLSLSISLSIVWPVTRLGLFNVTPQLSSDEKLEADNGQLTFGFQAGQFIGMGLAAWLLHSQEFITILFIATALFIISFIYYLMAVYGLNKGKARNEIKAKEDDFVEVLRRSVPFLPAFILSSFDFALVAIFNILLAAIVSVNYDNNSLWLAGLDASFAIGALFGGGMIATARRKRNTSMMDTVLTQLMFFVFLIFSVTQPTKYIAPLAIVLMGVFQSYSGIYWRTTLQRTLPKELMGRLVGIKYIVSSLYIGLFTVIISFAHEFHFNTAISVALAFCIIQATVLLIIYNKRDVNIASTL
jgi:MFS family permease